jgi:hypothetical protein
MSWLAAISLALRDGRPIGGDGVTQQKAQIVSCLTDDMGWALHGIRLDEVPA